MATVTIEFRKVMMTTESRDAPVYSVTGVTAAITSSAVSQVTATSAAISDCATVHNTGPELIRVAFGAAPVAAVDANSALIGVGERRDFGPMYAGWKAAVING